MRIAGKFFVGVAAVAGLAMATAASAQTATGTIGVTGNVTTMCAVVTGGSGNAFSGTIALGQLNAANGTILSTLSGSTSGAAAGSQSFRINCNGADASIDMSASRLSTTGATIAGFSKNIDYSTDLVANLASGSSKTFTYTTAAALPSDTIGTLGGRLANAAGNITVKIYALTPENGLTSQLEAGNYGSTITVSITPST